MTDPENLGGRTTLIEIDELTPAQQKLHGVMKEQWLPWAASAGFKASLPDGRLLGPFDLLLRSPEIAASFLELQRKEAGSTSLPPRVREIVILSVGAAYGSDYERYAHAAVARRAGLSDEQIASLRDGRPAPDLAPQEALAQRFALALSHDHRIDRTMFDEAKEAFGERGIVDLVLLAGCYFLVASLLNVFETPVPE